MNIKKFVKYAEFYKKQEFVKTIVSKNQYALNLKYYSKSKLFYLYLNFFLISILTIISIGIVGHMVKDFQPIFLVELLCPLVVSIFPYSYIEEHYICYTHMKFKEISISDCYSHKIIIINDTNIDIVEEFYNILEEYYNISKIKAYNEYQDKIKQKQINKELRIFQQKNMSKALKTLSNKIPNKDILLRPAYNTDKDTEDLLRSAKYPIEKEKK